MTYFELRGQGLAHKSKGYKKKEVPNKIINKWVNHLKERFTKEQIVKYLKSAHYCPCEALHWNCDNCIFNLSVPIENILGCKEALEFMGDSKKYDLFYIKLQNELIKT